MSIVTLTIAGSAAALSASGVPNRVLIEFGRPSIVAGSALGALAFMMATFSFAAKKLPNNVWLAAALLALISATFAWMAVKTTTMKTEILVSDDSDIYRSFFSLVGRPAMFVRFYCTRAAGQFSLAVGVNCYYL